MRLVNLPHAVRCGVILAAQLGSGRKTGLTFCLYFSPQSRVILRWFWGNPKGPPVFLLKKPGVSQTGETFLFLLKRGPPQKSAPRGPPFLARGEKFFKIFFSPPRKTGEQTTTEGVFRREGRAKKKIGGGGGAAPHLNPPPTKKIKERGVFSIKKKNFFFGRPL